MSNAAVLKCNVTCAVRMLGVGFAGSYSVSRGLSADTGHWHGYHAGANYDHTERVHYIRTGRQQF